MKLAEILHHALADCCSELGSLASLLENKTVPLDVLRKLDLAQQMAEGLAYLHAQVSSIWRVTVEYGLRTRESLKRAYLGREGSLTQPSTRPNAVHGLPTCTRVCVLACPLVIVSQNTRRQTAPSSK